MPDHPTITVAVPTCNRVDMLARALECLTAQQPDSDFSFQILVVDNGSDDHTVDHVSKLHRGNAVSVQVVVEPTRGIPFVRNHALSRCSSPWIAFFDDDQLTSPNWLRTLYQTALKEKADFVGGSRDLVFEDACEIHLGSNSRRLLGESLRPAPAQYHPQLLPSTGNVLLRRSLFDEIGSFDTTILDGGEDCDFFMRAILQGAVGIYNPHALVHHMISPARLKSEYLRWVAFRHGIHRARCDVRSRGKYVASGLALLRVAHFGVLHVPRVAYSRVVKDDAGTLDGCCRLSKVRGFCTFTLNEWFCSGSLKKDLLVRATHLGRR